MERQHSWTRHARLGLALAGASAVTLHLWVPWGSGSAFAPVAPVGIAPFQMQTAARPARLAEPFSDQGGGAAWSLGVASSVLFLCSMATRQRGLGLGRKAQQGTRRWQVTICHTFGPAMICPLAESRRAQNTRQDGPQMPSTIATTPCTVSLNVPRAVPAATGFVEPLAAVNSKASIMNHRQAFCVNGVRRTKGRSANRRSSSTSSAGRTARRSVGARLRPVPEVASSPAVAYDPSRLRIKIQHGLQASRQPGNSAHHRECKTPVACNHSVDQPGKTCELRSCTASLF